jgi:hypothetical protein
MVLTFSPMSHPIDPVRGYSFLKTLNPRLKNFHHHPLPQRLFLHIPEHLLPDRGNGSIALAHVTAADSGLYASLNQCEVDKKV